MNINAPRILCKNRIKYQQAIKLRFLQILFQIYWLTLDKLTLVIFSDNLRVNFLTLILFFIYS